MSYVYRRSLLLLVALLALGVLSLPLAAAEGSSLPDELTDDPLLNSRFLLSNSKIERRQVLRWIKKRGDPDMVAALIYMLRYWRPEEREEVARTLQRLTGHRTIGDDWFRWVAWQQTHPEIVPFEGFALFQSLRFGSIDPELRQFIFAR